MAIKKKSNKTQGSNGGNGDDAFNAVMAKGKGKMDMLFQLMSMMEGGSWGGGKGGGKGAGAGGHSTDSWKMRLSQALQKKGGHDGKLTYETNEVDSESNKAYQSTVDVNGSQYCGEPAASKKLAEHNAAKAALEDLFPDVAVAGAVAIAAVAQGKKRKHADKVLDDSLSNKNRLNNAIVNLIPVKEGAHRHQTKEDVVYVTESTGKLYTSTVTLKITSASYQGEACASTREAEHSAAAVAFEAIREEAEAAIAQNDEKRREKKRNGKDSGVAFFAKKKAEKEAKKAAA